MTPADLRAFAGHHDEPSYFNPSVGKPTVIDRAELIRRFTLLGCADPEARADSLCRKSTERISNEPE